MSEQVVGPARLLSVKVGLLAISRGRNARYTAESGKIRCVAAVGSAG